MSNMSRRSVLAGSARPTLTSKLPRAYSANFQVKTGVYWITWGSSPHEYLAMDRVRLDDEKCGDSINSFIARTRRQYRR